MGLDDPVAPHDAASADAERDRYAQLFEAIPAAVIATDEVGRILDANRAAVDLLDVALRVLRDKLLVSFVDPSARSEFRRWLREPPQRELVFRIERRDGCRRTVAATVAATVLRQDCRAVRLVWLLRDLSATTSLERRLEEMGTALALVERLSALQRLTVSPDVPPALLGRVAAIADELVAGVAVTIRMQGTAPVTGAGALGQQLSDAETALGEGPSFDAIASGAPVAVAGLELGRRWAKLGTIALQHEVSAAIAVPVIVNGEPVGAVTGWQREGPPPDEVLLLLNVVAEQLAVAASNARLHGDAVAQALNLRKALESRGVIERAKGILMQASGLTADEAFAALRTESQRQNRKLRDIALDVTEWRTSVGGPGRTSLR